MTLLDSMSYVALAGTFAIFYQQIVTAIKLRDLKAKVKIMDNALLAMGHVVINQLNKDEEK